MDPPHPGHPPSKVERRNRVTHELGARGAGRRRARGRGGCRAGRDARTCERQSALSCQSAGVPAKRTWYSTTLEPPPYHIKHGEVVFQ